MNEPYIFLDTDIGPDCDDTAALAILLQLCREGHGSLIGATHCTGSPYGLAMIDAVCRRFGVSVPLGTCADHDFLMDNEATLCYTPSVALRFPHAYPPEVSQPDALQVFRDVLADVPDDSVLLIGIGPLNNIARYLADPDTNTLMHRKVARIALMAGRFDIEMPEWNIETDVPAAQTVTEFWKKELVMGPWEAFGDVLTGASLRDGGDSPVRTAYALHTKGTMLRPSWDPGTVLCAITGASPCFAGSERGTIRIDGAGVTRLFPDSEGKHRYYIRTADTKEAAARIENVLAAAVITMKEANAL